MLFKTFSTKFSTAFAEKEHATSSGGSQTRNRGKSRHIQEVGKTFSKNQYFAILLGSFCQAEGTGCSAAFPFRTMLELLKP